VLKAVLHKEDFEGRIHHSTYTYDLSNIDRSATLKRTLIYNTKITQKDNGQSIEETSISGRPTETVKIDNNTYTLTGYDFSRTNITDKKPAINYYAGDISGRKVYSIGNATGAATQGRGTVTVDITGKYLWV
jgi:hypothetical protein